MKNDDTIHLPVNNVKQCYEDSTIYPLMTDNFHWYLVYLASRLRVPYHALWKQAVPNEEIGNSANTYMKCRSDVLSLRRKHKLINKINVLR